MCTENGSPLPLAGSLRGLEKLQSVPTLPDLHVDILLDLFFRDFDLALERGLQRGSVLGKSYANKLYNAMCHIWHNRARPYWIHNMASELSMAGSNDH